MKILLAALLATSAVGAAPPTDITGTEITGPEVTGHESFVQAETLELARERYSRLTVPVTIMGEGPFRFMIDTGAQATVLSKELADTLRLHDRSIATLIGMASSRTIETTMIPDFQLGRRNFYIHTAPLVETANIGGADGILGVDSLQDQRVLIDFRKQLIAVADAEELGGNSGYEIVVKAREKLGQLIITNARLNGVKTAVIVDTGAQGSVGNIALFERLRRARSLGDTEMTDINGIQLSGAVRVASRLEIDDVQLNNVPIVFADALPFHALGLGDTPALVLGMRELQLFRRVAIDFKTQRILFDLPRGIEQSRFQSFYAGV